MILVFYSNNGKEIKLCPFGKFDLISEVLSWFFLKSDYIKRFSMLLLIISWSMVKIVSPQWTLRRLTAGQADTSPSWPWTRPGSPSRLTTGPSTSPSATMSQSSRFYWKDVQIPTIVGKYFFLCLNWFKLTRFGAQTSLILWQQINLSSMWMRFCCQTNAGTTFYILVKI